LTPGIDVKAKGMVVAPGSSHASGGTYEWDECAHPDEVPLAEPPGWLLDLLGGSTRRTPKESDSGAEASPSSAHSADETSNALVYAGTRHTAMTSAAASLRAKGMSGSVIERTLLADNEERYWPPLPEAEVREIARWAGGLPSTRRELSRTWETLGDSFEQLRTKRGGSQREEPGSSGTGSDGPRIRRA